jgi:hypothetical protein
MIMKKLAIVSAIVLACFRPAFAADALAIAKLTIAGSPRR